MNLLTGLLLFVFALFIINLKVFIETLKGTIKNKKLTYIIVNVSSIILFFLVYFLAKYTNF